MTIAAHKDLINMSIGQNIARLYYKGASDSEVLRHCQRMQRRYLDAAAAITLEVKLSGEDDAPRGQPETAELYYHDWFTGLQRYAADSDECASMLAYAQCFYFGE